MILNDLTLPLGSTAEDVRRIAAHKAGLNEKDVKTFLILRKSIDARKKGAIREVYGVMISAEEEHLSELNVPWVGEGAYRPIVVGFGPAGIFASYVLALSGMRPLVLERGLSIEERTEKVNALWQRGELDPRANAEFGEGGAGAFSDGKLNSGIKEKDLSRFILKTFVKFGAPEEILYDAKPHIGTDRLRDVIRRIREEIIRLGGEVRFGTQVTDLTEEKGHIRLYAEGDYLTDRVILSIGHSARDTYEALRARGFMMENKPFAVGVRIEQLQEDINQAMYGVRRDPCLPPADYKVVEHTSLGGVYSFCMCPGGSVVCASHEEGSVVTNGMSNHARDGKNANAALLFGVGEETFGTELLSGVRFQRDLERKAFLAGGGGYKAPCQRVGDFLKKQKSGAWDRVQPSYLPGVTSCDLNAILPEKIGSALRLALPKLDQRIRGFARAENLLTGVETRSSSPVRVLRGEDMQSLSHPHVYPCGEGCGYAGGIMSAGVDGVKVALTIIGERG